VYVELKRFTKFQQISPNQIERAVEHNNADQLLASTTLPQNNMCGYAKRIYLSNIADSRAEMSSNYVVVLDIKDRKVKEGENGNILALTQHTAC
jgi:hypothetical protein